MLDTCPRCRYHTEIPAAWSLEMSRKTRFARHLNDRIGRPGAKVQMAWVIQLSSLELIAESSQVFLFPSLSAIAHCPGI